MEAMFSGCSSFNQPLNNWNVSNVTNMAYMFAGCSSFNQPLSSWDVSNVTNMESTFDGCSSFNQPLNNWNVSNVTNMESMFAGCSSFNQPLNDWNVSNVTNMRRMFYDCTNFNQPLNDWDMSNVEDDEGMLDGTLSFRQQQEIQQQEIRQQQEPEDPFYFDYLNQTCFDLITIGNVPISRFIENEGHIVFVFINPVIDPSLNSPPVCVGLNVKELSLDDPHYIVYECLRPDTLRPTNVNLNTPYYDIKKLCGFGDVVLFDDFSANVIQRYQTDELPIYIFHKTDQRLASTVSHNFWFNINDRNRAVSARHCQEGQSADVYKRIENVIFGPKPKRVNEPNPATGGKRTKKGNHKRTHKQTNTHKKQKRHRKKIKTTKRKYKPRNRTRK
jgi:surface protein